jgi:hypothetical protein
MQSEIKYSSKFKNLLRLIDHRVAKILLHIENESFQVTQNYIDITDKKDTVSFTPDRKVAEIKATIPQLWKTSEYTRHLTHGSANDKIYEDLGYEKPNRDPWSPEFGTLGTILGEAKSRTTDKVYVIFQIYQGDYKVVVNKETLIPTTNFNKIWSSNRNSIRIGRLTRSLLTSAGTKFSEKDIEEFTNKFKAAYDFNKDSTNKFDIVSGEDIAKWYHYEKYTKGGGTLNNSCMANVKSDFFEIYVKNPNVKLVILYDDCGKIDGGKYTSDKIKGRAILWESAKCVGIEDTINFMDRIYTSNDSDTDLFKTFAESKNFWYKKSQNMDFDCYICNGVIEQKATITVELNETNFAFYPYTDTMSFANLDDNTLMNFADNYDRRLRGTNGGYEGADETYFDPQDYEDYEDEDDEYIE